jgi:hypothetical protein
MSKPNPSRIAEIVCTVTEADLLNAVLELQDPLAFIVGLDNWISDYEFTLELISKLVKSMLENYKATELSYTEMILETTFGDESTWPSYRRSAQLSDLESATRGREAMQAMLKMLKDLHE